LKLRAPRPRTIRPTRPNEGVRADYRRHLVAMIDEMEKSVSHWILQAYKAKLPHAHPEMQGDASPARNLEAVLGRLTQRWTRKFNRRAPGSAKAFTEAARSHSESSLRRALRASGFSVEFQPTRAMNDAFQAVVSENVGLIKSIPQECLKQVRSAVMQSVAKGRDVGELADLIARRFAVARSRAELIARDQNNKATSVLNRARQRELGIKRAVWIHTPSSINPRESHLEADGKEFDLDKGCLIDGNYIFPGELINCGCISQSIIPGFEE